MGITEPGGGSDVANMKTSAKRDGNHFVINGSKTFITGAMTSDYFVVGARTGGSGLKEFLYFSWRPTGMAFHGYHLIKNGLVVL